MNGNRTDFQTGVGAGDVLGWLVRNEEKSPRRHRRSDPVGRRVRAEGDVGGFGVGSELDWQLLGVLQYQLDESIALEVGYRYLAVDYEDGGLVLDLGMHGPIIGGSIRF